MPLPVNVSVCTITGKFTDADGTPTVGSVVLIPVPPILLDAGAIPPTTIVGAPIAVDLDVNGAIPVGFTVPATDDVDLNPTGWTYKVIIHTYRYKPEPFYILAPGGTTVDLLGVIPVPESPGVPGDIVDGNRGDITVSGSGLIWNINPLVVGTPELAAGGVTAAKLNADVFPMRLAGGGVAGSPAGPTVGTDPLTVRLINLPDKGPGTLHVWHSSIMIKTVSTDRFSCFLQLDGVVFGSFAEPNPAPAGGTNWPYRANAFINIPGGAGTALSVVYQRTSGTGTITFGTGAQFNLHYIFVPS